MIEQIKNLHLRRKYLDPSPAKALNAAGDHILATLSDFAEKNSKIISKSNEQKTIILLVHDGLNTDLIAETLEST